MSAGFSIEVAVDRCLRIFLHPTTKATTVAINTNAETVTPAITWFLVSLEILDTATQNN